MKDKIVVMYTTVSKISEAKTLGSKAVFERLAMCVNILPIKTSIFRFKGDVHQTSEHAILFKTSKKMAKKT